MKNFHISTAILVFLSMAVSDVFWALYVRRAGQGKSIQAAVFSTAITLLSAFVIINYVGDWRYLLAAALGAFVGTILTVFYDAAKKKPGPR